MADFEGSFECVLDDKARIILPMKLRKAIPADAADTFTLTLSRGATPCIRMYPEHLYRQRLDILKQKLNPFSTHHDAFLRNFTYLSQKVTLDKQNRFIIQEKLLRRANISKNVLIIGMLDTIELWDPETYDRFDADFDDESYADIAAQIMGGE